MLLRSFLFILLCSLMVACLTNKRQVSDGLPSPDSAFVTGTSHGYNVYIWDCHEGKHIVIYNTSGEMTSSNYTREEAPCGELTPIEKQLADASQKIEVEPGTFWQRP